MVCASRQPLPDKSPRKKTNKGPAPRASGPQRAHDKDISPDKDIFSLLPTVSKPELLDKDGRSDRDFRKFLYDFSVLAAYLESARNYLASHLDLTSPQYNIVMILAQYQGANGMSVSEVARHLHVTTAFITGEIRKLGHDGIVEKRRNPKDGRGVLLRLTAAGRARVQRTNAQRLLVNDRLFNRISGEDFRHLSQTVASLIDDFAQTTAMLKAMRKNRPRQTE